MLARPSSHGLTPGPMVVSRLGQLPPLAHTHRGQLLIALPLDHRYVDTKSPMAAHVVTCNSMGVGCCAHHGTGKQADKCWERESASRFFVFHFNLIYPSLFHRSHPGSNLASLLTDGDAPSGGDRTTAGMVTSHFYTNQMTLQRGSWSWDRSENSLDQFFGAKELLWTLISTTAWNGTLVVNVGE